MKRAFSAGFLLVLAAACGGGGGGAGGTGGGPAPAGGSGGTGGAGTGGASTGGAPAVDAATGGAGAIGAAVDAAPADATTTALDGAAAVDAGPPASGERLGFYEAEAIPPNMVFSGAVAEGCKSAPPCPPGELKPGVLCCSGGRRIRQLLRGVGGMQFNAVAAPSDGMYDVTWWYHCGNKDNFGDPVCHGEPHTDAGCRPGQLVVNGATIKPIFEFPCFDGDFGIIRAATTPLPLKAGAMNTIRITAGYRNNDSIDVDAISVYPAGKGLAPALPKSVSGAPP